MAGDRNTAPGDRSRRTPLPPFASPGLPGGAAATQSSGVRPSRQSRPFWTPPAPVASGEPTAGPPAMPPVPVTPLPEEEDWPSEAEWAGAANASGERAWLPGPDRESAIERAGAGGTGGQWDSEPFGTGGQRDSEACEPGGQWDSESSWATAPDLPGTAELEALAAPVVAEAPSLEDVDAEIESDCETGVDGETWGGGEKGGGGNGGRANGSGSGEGTGSDQGAGSETAGQGAEGAGAEEPGAAVGAAMAMERLAERIRDGSLALPDGVAVGSDAALLAAVLSALLHERAAS